MEKEESKECLEKEKTGACVGPQFPRNYQPLKLDVETETSDLFLYVAATRFGKGCYFALHSRYSAGYTSENSSGKKCILVARVLTGDCCEGKPYMKVPPNKPNTQDRKYDSVVDDVENPTIFVVFKDTR